MKWKSLFAAALSAAVTLPAWAQETGGNLPSVFGQTINVNFTSGRDNRTNDVSGEALFGIYPVDGVLWDNITGATGTDVALKVNGEASDAKMTFKAVGTWSVNAANMELGSTNALLGSFLDDSNNTNNGLTGVYSSEITVSAIPFETYDVYLYSNVNNGSGFAPIEVNGDYYTFRDGATVITEDPTEKWGTVAQNTPAYGTNVLVVRGLTTDTLTIKTLKRTGGASQGTDAMARGSFAGFQIVESKPTISVNFSGTSAGPTAIADVSGFSGRVPVLNENWNDVSAVKHTAQKVERLVDNSGERTAASVTVNMGGQWSLAADGGFDLIAERTARLGAMGNGYNDANENANVAELTLNDIPYTQYSVILYLATDNGTQWAPIGVTKDGTTTYYTYTGSEPGNAATPLAEAPTAENPGLWGATSDVADATNTGVYGKDVVLIEGLSGDITIDTGRQNNPENARGGLAGFQIVCTGDVIEVAEDAISVNFATGGRSGDPAVTNVPVSGFSGLAKVPGSAWTNIEGSSGTDVALTLWGAEETTLTPKMTFSAVGSWSFADASITDPILHSFLGDGNYSEGGSVTPITISVDDIPFSQYDVIVYYATNTADAKFKPVNVNGTWYTWNDETQTTVPTTNQTQTFGQEEVFGQTRWPTLELGKNALRITGQSGPLSLISQMSNNGEGNRGNIAGFQIVCTGDILITTPAKEGVISLNFGSNKRAVPENATTYGLVPVAGKKWQNFSGASGTDVAITRAENTDLAGAPTVTFSASGTWENSAATDPFMYGYLDDNDTISEATDGVAVSVDVANVPFGAYDVIVYQSTDSTSYEFFPVQVNSAYYRWDDALGTTVTTTDTSADAAFGQGAQAATAYGVNAIRVKAQTGALALRTLPRVFVDQYGQNQRGCLAAVQLVERKVIEVSGTGFDLAVALAAYDDDTPVLITFTDGATVTGDVTLPADAVVDLTAYTFGETAPFGGALTVNEGSEIRLPGGAASYTLASSINGTRGLVMQGDTYITDASISGGTITRPVTYEWVGGTNGNNWSNSANWSSSVVPDENSTVTVNLNADDAKTITLDTAATVASLTITGPASGTATLAINGAETASLTIAGQMATSGNVTVTQNANITVNGAATAAEGNVPAGYYAKGSFDVNGATYTLSAGTLTVGNLESGVFLVGNGATFTVGGGEEAATLSFPRTGVLYPIPLVDSRIIVAANGTLSSRSALDTPSNRYKWELAGGTLALATEAATRIRVFGGIEVSGDSTLSFAAQTANIIVMGENPSALTGTGDLALSGAGTFSFGTSNAVTSGAPLTGYTGELSVPSGLTLVLGEARPALTVAEGATVNIKPTAEEQAAGRIAFGTSMTADPNNVTFTVEGVDAVTPAVDNGTLTLSWAASTATLATSGDWSAFNWTVGETTGQAAPTSGVVVLDGTAGDGITVTLDTPIPAAITTINVRGNVTLVATEQQDTLPTCINVEDGATLGVGANFAKADGSAWPDTWDIPANTTLRVTGDSFDFVGITVDHNQYIQVYADLVVTATGAEGKPALIEPENNLWCRGKVTVSGSDVTLKRLYWLDDVTDGLTVTGNNVTIDGLHRVDGSDGLTLSGNNVTITGDVNGLVFAAGATITSSGTGNVLDGLTDLPTELHVTGGDLTIDSCATLGGALLTNGATLKLASDWASGQELKVSAGDNSATTLDLSAINPANRPTLNRYSDTYKTLPKTIIVAPSVEETEAGVIDITLLQDLVPAADTVVQVVAEPAWNPAWEVVTEGGKKLRITNVVLKPVLPEGSTLSEAATAALNAAAEQAGITGEYDVAITTKGEPVQVADAADVARLQEVLDCFTGVATGDSASNTVTVAYDFGIVGIARTAEGWVVTAKVQGAGGAVAGFAEGNVYTLTVNGTEVSVAGATVGEGGTVTLPLADTEVQGDGPLTLGVKVSRPDPTPAQ